MTRLGDIAEAAQAEAAEAAVLPKRMDRKTAAKRVTRDYFPVSPRSLEAWPINWIYVNGRAVGETNEILAVAQAKLDEALAQPRGRPAALEAAHRT